MAGLELEKISDVAGFERLGAEWDELVAAAPRPSPFLLQGWLVPWWCQFGAGRQLAVEIARRDGKLVAALPVFVERKLGLRIARFVGGAQAEIADLLLAPGEGTEIARGLVERVESDVIHVFGLPADSTLAGALAPEPVRLVVRAEAPVLRVPGSWDELYQEKMSGQRRRLHRKRLRQLEEAGRVELTVARTVDELGPALEEAFRLHALRWHGQPDRSGFVTDAGKDFHRAAMRALAPQGVPRIVSLLLDGATIGFYYYLVLGERVCGGDMAYDPAFGKYSPGWIATMHMLEVAIGEGAREIEFLGSTEEYKLVFADGLEPLHEGLARPKGLLGRGYVEGRLGALAARRRLKESEQVRKLYYDGLAPLRRRIASS